jgi:DNA-binding IclR family transcriptional regulator
LRALSPFTDRDARLLEAVNRGEFAVNGFRNRDLVPLLDLPAAHTQQELRRRSAKVTRLLALLRAHGLIRKVPGTHRYLVTTNGKLKITAALAARRTSVAKLVANAA